MKTIRKGAGALLLAGLLLLLPALPAAAAVDTPYDGYQYNEKDKAVAAPVGYLPQKTVSGRQMPVGTLGNASDMVADSEGQLYIVDTDNGCIVVLDEELAYQTTLTFKENGADTPLPGLAGLFIQGNGEERRYYAADPENQRVIVADSGLHIQQVITRPDSALLPENVLFAPDKVLVDEQGTIFVLLPGLYRGACVFSPQGEFLTFFGSNKVELSARMLLDYFWKGLLNEDQKDSMARYIPVEYSNFDITPDGFIYTVTQKSVAGGSVVSTNEIKKMNAKSVNVYKEDNYGDLEVAWSDGRLLDTAFVDIDVMQNGFVAALDATQGRVFLYDENGQWITVFGGIGVLEGTFRIPVAIETIGQRIYVLDQMADTVTMFTPSAFGEKIFAAMELYNQGDYDESVSLWQDVIRYAGGYDPAYISIGKTYLDAGDYENAMAYFRMGHAPELYSDAFKQHRNAGLRQWFYPIFAVLAILAVWIVVSDSRDRVSRSRDVDPGALGPGRRLRYTLFHPTGGYESAVRRGTVRSKAVIAAGCLAAWFFATALTWQYNGYVFNQNTPEEFSIWVMLGSTLLVFSLFVLANWFVSTMMDGSGKLLDIVYVLAVGLIPYVAYQLLSLLLTNVLVREEGAFLTLLMVIFLLWSAVLMLLGLKAIHEFSFGRTVLAVLYSFIGILIILFLALLLWSLFTQLAMFVTSLLDELSLKLK